MVPIVDHWVAACDQSGASPGGSESFYDIGFVTCGPALIDPSESSFGSKPGVCSAIYGTVSYRGP